MISSKSAPSLSAIVVVGEMRERAQLVIDRLATQTVASAMEIVIADTASESCPRLIDPTNGIPVRYLKCASSLSWGEARAVAAQAASAPLAAFIEDHSIPTPTWAEGILRASDGGLGGRRICIPQRESGKALVVADLISHGQVSSRTMASAGLSCAGWDLPLSGMQQRGLPNSRRFSIKAISLPVCWKAMRCFTCTWRVKGSR